MTPRLFLSHAVADSELVETFETALSKATGIPSKYIFCSSLEGQGVAKGQDFVSYIRDEVKKADAVVALLTPAYLDSAFCMAELGAAWVLGTHRFPIVVPPLGFEAVNATQLGLTAIKINDQDALSQMFEDLNQAIGFDLPKDGIRRRAVKNFQKDFLELSASIAGPQSIEIDVHKKLKQKCKKLKEQLSETDEQINHLEEVNAKLRATKDKAEVAKIDEEYEDPDLESEFESLIDAVLELEEELGGPAVLEHAIMDHYDRAGKIDWDRDEPQFEIAIKHGVYDTESSSLIWSSKDLSELSEALEKLNEFLHENADAHFLTEQDRRGPEDARFWRNRL